MTTRRTIAATLVALIAVAGLAACSSSTPEEPASASAAAASGPAEGGGPAASVDPAMAELGDSIVAAKTPVDAAGKQIEAAGYTWRVLMLDGEPQAGTMDLRPDRFNLNVENGIVVGYTTG
jgi:hypothetical protein